MIIEETVRHVTSNFGAETYYADVRFLVSDDASPILLPEFIIRYSTSYCVSRGLSALFLQLKRIGYTSIIIFFTQSG